ncbi:MAG: amino acid racemase [Campylobacter sp.]|nr:amino acid racemase [Campylobacter sp.]
MKLVGIIGGMGPLASIDLYQKVVELTHAKCDQDNIPLVIDNNTLIPDRTAYIMGGKNDPFPQLLKSANRLKNAGCDAFCMACNTAHFFADRLVKESSLPILHIAKITVNSIKINHPNAKKIAILSTVGTRKAEIYDKELKLAGFEMADTSQESMEKLMSCIYDGVKAGKIKEYLPEFKEVLGEIEADVYIAACTEIPLFLPYIDDDKIFVDATLELAKEIVRFAKS